MHKINNSKREEYDRLRRGVVLTSASAMQKLKFSGSTALDGVNRVVLGDVSRLAVGRLMSTPMLKPDGSVYADVYLWNQGDTYLLLGESNTPGRFIDFISEHGGLHNDCEASDVSDEFGLIGLDGPFSWELLKDEVSVRTLGLRYLEAMPDQMLAGIPLDILRAGKTGEFGYLLKCAAEDSDRLRDALLELGRPLGLQPCGTEALELAKLENRFTNMKREGFAALNVLELNVRIMVSREKGDYVGREAIEAVLDQGLKRRIIGIRFDADASLPELGAEVRYAGETIGVVASVDFSYTLECGIGLAFIDVDYAYVGCTYELHGGVTVRTVSAPFVFNRSLTIRPQEDSIHTVDWSIKAAASTAS
jgi:aminomethyltransferase